MVKEGESNSEKDKKVKEQIEARNNLDSMIINLRKC